MTGKKWISKIIIIVLSIYLLIPFLATFIYSLSTEWTSILPTGFTLRNYQELFSDSEFWLSVMRTLIICVVSVAVTIVLLLLAMFVVMLESPRLGKYVQIFCMIPYALQGVILSIGIISLYSGTGTLLSNRMVMLFGAYTILVLPYIYQGIRNNINAINGKTLIQAAQMLGCSQFKAYVKVVIPNIMSGIVVSCLLAVGIVFGDFVLANNIAGNNYQNIQVYLSTKMVSSSGLSSAIVVLIFIIVFAITATVLHLQSKSEMREK